MKSRKTARAPAEPTVARAAGTAALLCALSAWGCDKDLSREYEVIIRVSSDDARPIEGAQASLAGKALGASDASGALDLALRGREGDVLPIEIACPAEHRAPAPVLVPLRRVGSSSAGSRVKPEFAAVCTALTHSIVVAVRAERGPHLPLLHLGRELARTDASGAAHLLIDVASDDVVELVLDTTAQPQLRPKSPILRIQPGPGDEITAISQEFTLLEAKERVRKVTPPRGPTRIE